MSPRRIASRAVPGLLVLGCFGLAGCDNSGAEQTAGQRLDAAIARTRQAGEEGRAKLDALAKEARSEAKPAVSAAEETIKSEAAAASASLQSAGAAVAAKAADLAITARIKAEIAKDPDLDAAKIEVETQDGVVQLRGQAASDSARERAARHASTVQGVAAVENLIEVGRAS